MVARYPDSEEAGLLIISMHNYLGQVREAAEQLSKRMRRAWQRDYNIVAAAGVPSKDPEFMIIGTAKGGSTALYDYLIDHPLICPAVVKEVNFWSRYYSYGYQWYRSCFMPIPVTAPHITGEGSIHSLWHQGVPPRLAAFRKDMKLLLIVREPVARAYSDYHMRRRHGEEIPEWEERVEQELDRFPQCPLETDELPRSYNDGSLLISGAVLPFLKRWLQYFRRSSSSYCATKICPGIYRVL